MGDMSALQSRTHGRDRADHGAGRPCSASIRSAMSTPEHTFRNAASHRADTRRWLRSPSPPRQSSPPRLTLDDRFVIVISSTEKPSHPRDDAHAPSPFIDQHTSSRASYDPLRYKFHSAAP